MGEGRIGSSVEAEDGWQLSGIGNARAMTGLGEGCTLMWELDVGCRSMWKQLLDGYKFSVNKLLRICALKDQ